ncbi:hypothetical protein [uncultured Ferrovibrio sp.]|jgi:Uncharacterized membrane protein required for alginate biosynthesis|uniref:hypothetical protein n=1 Tax=uncultured Ferrovibrio sp. TaxID=1576913 RepID=UPI0026369190|nr:hypothetical protein [uncultured Ferrovibrio sp.]
MTEFDFAWAAIPARGLAAAVFVAGVIWLMERSSPFIGGIVLALPIVTAPAYVFLVLHHDPAFIGEAALGSLATVGAVLLFLVCVIAMIRRVPMPATLACAVATWLATATVIRFLPSSLTISLIVLGLCAATAWWSGRLVPLTAPAARGRSPLFEIILRGATAGLLVIGVSILAEQVGPQIAGIFTSFPVALLTVCWFLPRRLDAAGIRASLRATQIGLASHVPFFLSLALLGPFGETGDFTAFGVGILGSIAVALIIALLRRRQVRR